MWRSRTSRNPAPQQVQPQHRTSEHHGVRCDGCDREVVGNRYKCTVCDDYDLCEDCERNGTHSQHPMIRYTTSVAQQERRNVVHEGIICDGCDGEVVGNRYKCTVCHDYDLCEDCERQGRHSQHPMTRYSTPITPNAARARRFAPLRQIGTRIQRWLANFDYEYPRESGAAAARLRQEMDDFLLALMISSQPNADISSSSSQAADLYNTLTLRSRNRRTPLNIDGTPRQSGEQLCNRRTLPPGQSCVICFVEPPDEPVGCAQCRQIIGCRRCVIEWNNSCDRAIPNCPLCRAEWYVGPDVVPWYQLRTN